MIKHWKFAVIVTWPDAFNAEYEVILRIQRAAVIANIECVLVNNDGFQLQTLDSPEPRRIKPEEIDFAISIHFESPKLFDAYTYLCLWNPIEFFTEWGYDQSIAKIVSHDDFLYSGSKKALRHAQRLKPNFQRIPGDVAEFYPSLEFPVLPPTLGEHKLFYCGMNWEKITKSKNRHNGLLKLLSQSGKLIIYGPESYMGMPIWEDYECYAGPIPFDGCSIIYEIHKAGICLALMSDNHFQSDIASSRLYEGLAAGVVVITDDHKFFRDRFSDNLLYISPLVSDERRFEQICEHLSWISRNPTDALNKARAAQEIFLKNYSMATLLNNLFINNIHRKQTNRDICLSRQDNDTIEVIVPFVVGKIATLQHLLDNLNGQLYKNIKINLIVDSKFYEIYEKELVEICKNFLAGEIYKFSFFAENDISGMGPRVLRLGEAIHHVVSRIASPFFCFLTTNESWFSDHLSRLKRLLEDHQESYASYSGVAIETLEINSLPKRQLDYVQFDRITFAEILKFAVYPSSFLFRSSMIKDDCLDLILPDLDGLEHLFFAILAESKSNLSPTGSATCVHSPQYSYNFLLPIISIELQQRYLKDLFSHAEPRLFYNYDEKEVGARRENCSFPHGLSPLRPGELIFFGKNSNCQKYMVNGWSNPEEKWCWIEGTYASLAIRPTLFQHTYNYFLRIDFESIVDNYGPKQFFSVIINGVNIVSVEIAVQSRHILSTPIPNHLLKPDEPLVIEFNCAYSSIKQNDLRELSARIFGLLVECGDTETSSLYPIFSDFVEEDYLQDNPNILELVKFNFFSSGYHHYLSKGFYRD